MNVKALTSPKIDVLLTSVIPFSIVLVFILFQVSLTPSTILGIYTLSSFPHFIASYDIAYSKKAFRDKNKFVLFYFPILVLTLIFGLFSVAGDIQVLIHLTIVMLIWHFIKQSYGVSIWAAIVNNTQLDPKIKNGILSTYLFIGTMAIFYIHDSSNSMNFFGQYIKLANLPAYIPDFFMVLTILYIIINFTKCHMQNKENLKGTLEIFLPVISTFFWFLAIKFSAYAIVILPFIHAIQYAPFVVKATKSFGRSNTALIIIYIVYIIAGYLILHQLPRFLSMTVGGVEGGILFSSVLITVNFHHYAIDSVIWKMRNKECRELVGL